MKNKDKIIHQLKIIEEILKSHFPQDFCKHKFVKASGTGKAEYCIHCGKIRV